MDLPLEAGKLVLRPLAVSQQLSLPLSDHPQAHPAATHRGWRHPILAGKLSKTNMYNLERPTCFLDKFPLIFGKTQKFFDEFPMKEWKGNLVPCLFTSTNQAICPSQSKLQKVKSSHFHKCHHLEKPLVHRDCTQGPLDCSLSSDLFRRMGIRISAKLRKFSVCRARGKHAKKQNMASS